MSGGTVDIDADIGIFDLDIDIIVGLWQHDDFSGRSVNTPIGLGNGNALHAMRAALVFHAAVRAPASDLEGDILDASPGRLVVIQYFDFPVFVIGIAAIHAEEFAREKRGLVTARAALDSDDCIFIIHDIFGQQGNFDLFE